MQRFPFSPRVLLGMLCLSLGLTHGVTITVTTPFDDFDTPSGGSISLREALRDATNGDVIDFSALMNGLTLSLTLSNLVVEGKTITVDASGLADGLTLSVADSLQDRIVDVAGPGTVDFVGIDFVGGRGVDHGGAIRNRDSAVTTFTNCRFSGNQAQLLGGAIYNENAELTLVDSDLLDNHAVVSGGGLFSTGVTSRLTLTRCEVRGNRAAQDGGGVASVSGTFVDLVDVTLHANRAARGGGIYNDGTHLRVGGSALFDNQAGGKGGGLFLAVSAQLTFRNSTLAANEAWLGAGLYAQSNSIATVNLSTIAENRAGYRGGGIYSNQGTLTLRNAIVAGNSARGGADIQNADGTVISEEVNLVGDSSSVYLEFPTGYPNGNGDYAGVRGAPFDAKLGALGHYGGPTPCMFPLAGSPAIDSAGSPGSIVVDQRNAPRPFGAASDLGAVEAGGSITVTTAVDEDNGLAGLGTGVSLREALKYGLAANEHVRIATNLNGAVLSLSSSLTVSNDTALIDASDLADGFTLNGGDSVQLLHLEDDAIVSLHRIHLHAGTNVLGGAVLSEQSRLTVDRCELMSNRAVSRGGALDVDDSRLFVSACTLTSNVVSGTGSVLGGAVSIRNESVARIVDSDFSHNIAQQGTGASGGAVATASDSRLTLLRSGFLNDIAAGDSARGGALYCGQGTGTLVSDCTFDTALALGSTSPGVGGAIGNFDGHLSVERSSFESCQVSSSLGGADAKGGAIHDTSWNVTINSPLRVENCTFSGNLAIGGGGAIATATSAGNELLDVRLDHLTLTRNFSEAGGGGILLEGAGGTVEIGNCLVAENSTILPIDGADIQLESGPDVTVTAPCLIGNNTTVETLFPTGPLAGTFALPLDPLLGTIGAYGGYARTVPLSAGSPAVDAGATSAVLTDQRLFDRVRGAAPDCGAYETGHAMQYEHWVIENLLTGQDTNFTDHTEADRHVNGAEYGMRLDAQVVEPLQVSNSMNSNGVFQLSFPYHPNAEDLIYKIQFTDDALMTYSNRATFDLSELTIEIPRGVPFRYVELEEDLETRTLHFAENPDASSISNGFWRVEIDRVP